MWRARAVWAFHSGTDALSHAAGRSGRDEIERNLTRYDHLGLPWVTHEERCRACRGVVRCSAGSSRQSDADGWTRFSFQHNRQNADFWLQQSEDAVRQGFQSDRLGATPLPRLGVDPSVRAIQGHSAIQLTTTARTGTAATFCPRPQMPAIGRRSAAITGDHIDGRKFADQRHCDASRA